MHHAWSRRTAPMTLIFLRKDQPEIAMDSMAEQSLTCRLLALPPEVRNLIWELLLLQDAVIPATQTKETLSGNSFSLPRSLPGSISSPLNPHKHRFCANILRTCKQIHAEGTPILYGANTFLAHRSLLTALPSFLLAARPNLVRLPPVTASRVAALIRRYYIVVRLDTDPGYSRAQVEECFTGVDSLEIEVFEAMYGSCDFSVLRLFEGIRGVGHASIRGSVRDGKYSQWLENTMMSPLGSETGVYSEFYMGKEKGWNPWQHGNR